MSSDNSSFPTIGGCTMDIDDLDFSKDGTSSFEVSELSSAEDFLFPVGFPPFLFSVVFAFFPPPPDLPCC